MGKTRNHKHRRAASKPAPYGISRLAIWAKFGMQQWASGLCLQAYFHLGRYIVSPRLGKGAEMSQFRQNCHILGGSYVTYVHSFTNPCQIWQQIVDPWSTLTRQI